MTPLPDVDSLIAVVRAEAGSSEPLDLLASAARSAAELEQVGDSLVDHFVEACRANGFSWSEISSALGVSKQAAHKRFATTTPTFERFTLRARAVLKDAVEQARRLGQPAVGTEHLLLALFEPSEALAAQVLHDAGLTVAAAEAELRLSPVGGELVTGQIGYAPAARTALRNAVDHALRLGHNYIGTEHLLIALYDEPGGVAPTALAALGLPREEAERRLAEKFASFRSKGPA
jgi:ClpA/ClpB-like protein